jgi:preprotein translocase subunit YajC
MMKKSQLLSTVVALALLASTTPVAALSVSTTVNGDASVSSDRSTTNASLYSRTNATVKNDSDKKDMSDEERSKRAIMDVRLKNSTDHWKTWAFNSGIRGTVTATSNDSITVKGSDGKTYTVDISDADIRGGSIETNDRVYVQGATNGLNIVATLVINGKTADATPSDEDKRMAIAGTVTAKSGTTLTVLSRNGTTYKVAAANATIWARQDKEASIDDIDVGDAVVVQGSVSGSSATATKIHVVKFPSTSANGGIRGTVTAVTDDTLTLMIAGGTTYTVHTDDADFKDRKGKDEDEDAVDVGDHVVVTGDVDGSTIDAEVVSEAKANGKFFSRVGLFFKGLF